MAKKDNNLVTIYSSGMLGINKVEAKLVDHGTKKYAQYDNAPYVRFIPTRKRKVRGIQDGYKPYILILKGQGHPDLETWKPATEPTPGVIVREALYSMCDARWDTDADTKLDAYIAESGAEVIADYRHTKGFNSHDRFSGK